MAINFPSNPTNSQEITEGNVTYVYNATKGYWESSEGSSSGASTTVYTDMTALIAATGMSNGDQAFVTGNNNLYIYSGSGWYKVATVQQDAPSAITGVSGTYELAVDGTATTITAVSTDPEGFPLTWSYSASGLGNIATISQVDNAFTITPSTTIADAGTFSLTINVTDGINGAVSTSTNLTLEFIIIVTNSRYTTLLATATGTSDNNSITDASTNSHTITTAGDAHAGTFSPYRNRGYSTYFKDTAANVLYASPSSDFAFGTGAFTISVWVKLLHQWLGTIFDTNDGINPGVMMQVNNITFYTYSNTWLSSTSTSSQDVWQHFCWTRDGSGNNKVFVNGTQATTFTDSTDYTSQNFKMGEEQSGGNDLKAYIKDLHIVKGYAYEPDSTYADGAAEPTTGTVFLGCGLPYHGDKSSSPKTLTIANSGISIVNETPHDYLEYDAADHGGSLYFDGNGDAIEIADNDDFDFGTGDLTIECWVYPEVTGNNYPGFLGTTAGWGSVAASGMRFDNLGDSKFQMSWYGPGDPFLETQSTYLHDQWYHFVVTRTGGNTWRMFINGILEDVATNSTPYDICVGGHNLQVGGKTWDGGNGWFKGNVADLRLTKGSIVTEYQASSAAIGTRIFTPRTTPITSSGSELHIKGTDASIIDKSQGSNLKLFGNTTGSTTQAKFGGSKSMYFDGTGDYIRGPTISDLNIGTGDFTVECWLYETTANTNRGIWDGRSSYISTDGFTFTRIGTDTFRVWSGSALITTGSFTIQNTWNHCALVRNSGTLTIYINGTSSGTPVSNSTNFSSSGTFIIGAGMHTNSPDPNAFITGYIQDLRVNNYARYTANFTPPTAPLEG